MDARSSKGQSRLLKPVDLAGDQPESPLVPRQFEYGFDDIGNRSSTKAGGDSSGYNLRSATYTVNNLNQYSSRTVPAAFDVIGIADAGSTVSINTDSTGFYRRGQYFRKELSVANSTTPVWQSVSVTTSGGGSASGNVWVAKTPENYGFDLDGNQTSDGRCNYTWDAENRLRGVAERAAWRARMVRRAIELIGEAPTA